MAAGRAVRTRWSRAVDAVGRRLDRTALGRRVRRWPHWHHFCVNLAIGLLIEVVIHFMVGGMFVTTVRNAVQDATMNVAAHLAGSANPSRPGIAVFDVDDETWRDPVWGGGEPDLAPRPQVARLIDIAARAHARTIVVDIVVEGSGNAADAPFAADLARIARGLAPDQRILLVRSIRAPLCAASPCGETDGAPTLRASPLDAAVAGSGGRLVAVAPNFIVSPDGVLRGWILWKPACVVAPGQAAGTWRALPSVQLAVRELERVRAQGGTPVWDRAQGFGRCRPTMPDGGTAPDGGGFASLSQAEAAMERAMAPALGGDHGAAAAEHGDAAAPEHGPAKHDPASIVFFRYASGTGPVAAGGNGIQTLSARTLLDGRDPGDLSEQVVIVAQSHEVARDHHLTPLGRQPGAMVLANSINSMRDPGVIAHAPGALEYLFAFATIVLAAWLFAVVHAAFSALLAIAFVPVLLLVSYLSLGAGFQLGSEIALLGIYLHWLFKTIETALEAGQGHHAGHHPAPEEHDA